MAVAADAGESVNLESRTSVEARVRDSVDVGDSPSYPSRMDYRQLITIEPGKRGGKPCVRGLRITVTDVLEYLASGMSVEEILADFPDLTDEDVRACLAFAADRERRLWVLPAA